MPKNKLMYRAVSIVSVLSLLMASVPLAPAHALSISGRKFTISNSNGAASGVSYVFDSSALLTTGTPIRSVKAEACTTASGACSTPAGFTGAGANLTAQPTGLGAASAWADDSNAGNLRITHASNSTNPSGVVNIQWDTVTNPTADNATFYLRVTTYSDAAYSTAVDSGTVAVSTAEQITVTASVDETLTFCTGASGVTNSSCSGATGSTVALGAITPSTTGSGTSQIGVSTNASSGYAITIAGTTLTSGGNTITAAATQAASAQGTEQFGLNLVDNSTPDVGTTVDGSGSATPTANYNTVNQFRFVTGDTIASKNSSDNFRRFHATYIANVAGATEAGSYTTNLTFVATANF